MSNAEVYANPLSPAADNITAINNNNIHMETPLEAKEEEDLSFSFIFCTSSWVAFLWLLLMRLTAQNIITIGKINIASCIGYAAYAAITTEISSG
jgi:hypothetical protein